MYASMFHRSSSDHESKWIGVTQQQSQFPECLVESFNWMFDCLASPCFVCLIDMNVIWLFEIPSDSEWLVLVRINRQLMSIDIRQDEIWCIPEMDWSCDFESFVMKCCVGIWCGARQCGHSNVKRTQWYVPDSNDRARWEMIRGNDGRKGEYYTVSVAEALNCDRADRRWTM